MVQQRCLRDEVVAALTEERPLRQLLWLTELPCAPELQHHPVWDELRRVGVEVEVMEERLRPGDDQPDRWLLVLVPEEQDPLVHTLIDLTFPSHEDLWRRLIDARVSDRSIEETVRLLDRIAEGARSISRESLAVLVELRRQGERRGR